MIFPSSNSDRGVFKRSGAAPVPFATEVTDRKTRLVNLSNDTLYKFPSAYDPLDRKLGLAAKRAPFVNTTILPWRRTIEYTMDC